MSTEVLFDGWSSIWRTATVAGIGYFVLLLILRGAGKRTIAQMNAYDLVVTVALGSVLASAITSDTVSASDAGTAFLVLVGLQFSMSWISVRVRQFRKFLTGEPTVLLYRGEPLRKAMRRQRVTESELFAAVRAGGVGSLAEVEAVVLETDGSFSVIKAGENVTYGSSEKVIPDRATSTS